MLSIFKFLIISRFLSTISADTSLLFGDTDPLPYDLFSDDDLEFGEALFEEPPPELLSFDGCSSGDLGYGLTGDVEWTSKMRRRDACRSEIAPTTDDPDRTPPDTSGTQTVNGLNSLFQEYNIDTYMPPPEFQDLGCQSLWGKVFKYTVCGSGKRDDQSLSAELDVMITSFTVQNCQLCKYQPCPTLPAPHISGSSPSFGVLRQLAHVCSVLFLLFFKPSITDASA